MRDVQQGLEDAAREVIRSMEPRHLRYIAWVDEGGETWIVTVEKLSATIPELAPDVEPPPRPPAPEPPRPPTWPRWRSRRR